MAENNRAERILGFQRFFIPGVYLLISLMLMLFVISLQQVARRFTPEWQGTYLPWAAFVVALESFYSYHFLKKQKQSALDWGWWVYTASEWIFWIVGLRVLMFAVEKPQHFWASLSLEPGYVVSVLTEYDFLFSLACLLVSWGMARSFARDLEELLVAEYEVNLEISGRMHIARAEIRQRMVGSLLFLAGIMVVAVAVTRLDIRQLFGSYAPYSAPVINMAVYFMLLLVFFTVSEFFMQRESWLLHKIPFDRQISTRWLLYALLLFFSVTIVAILLPTRYTLNLLEIFQTLLNGLWKITMTIVQILVAILEFLFMGIIWLFSLLGLQSGTPAQPPKMPEFTAPIAPVQTITYPFWEMIKSILFWGALLAIVVFGIDYYLRQNRRLFESLKQMPLASWLKQVWSWIRNFFKGVSLRVAYSARQGLEGLRGFFRIPQPIKKQPRLHLSGRPASQQVMLLYWAFLQFFEQQGTARQPAETPDQFDAKASSTYPAMREQVNLISQLFQEARYTTHEIPKGQVPTLKRAFHRLRAFVKGQRRDQK